RDFELPAHLLAAAATEDICALPAVRTSEGAHVLNDAEDGDMHGLEHSQTTAGDLQAYVLRRRHDDRTRQRVVLRQRQLGVARPGREVENQVVQRSPLHPPDEEVK